ncbi:MAG: hypothetical protein DWQ07_17040 [Chloroflexi bacterium]|nr:MAG: hypothetical protein DWQ07_17040 [Chloroflexota bacterium]MBL1195111.1 hypothetical protein [Chloroflexota bacterium]NOH12396.1 hypothetical protein [Chloroflexota bacterium]
MIGIHEEPRPVSISTHLYRILLAAYPSGFRQEYGPYMAQLFRDQCVHSYRRSGPSGMLWLWTLTLFDFFMTVLEEHLQRETFMSKEKFMRLSGWGMMLGALALVLGFAASGGESSYYDPLGGRDGFYEYAQLFLVPSGIFLITLGILGLRMRYGKHSGILGNLSLLLSAASGFVSFIAAIPLFILNDGPWWEITMGGLLNIFVGLAVFGLAALRRKPLPRWNALPLLTGIAFPILLTVGVQTDQSGEIVGPIVMLWSSVGVGILGYLLRGDVPREPFPVG